jgi:outer membrane protein assembly factor BamB
MRLPWQRMPFDQCYEPIVVGKTLFFGSSREDCLVALDTDTGQERWRFPVDGPVRLPAVASSGKVLFAPDDGFLYCVSQDSGRLL